MTRTTTIPAYVQQVDETGFVWTLLEEADEPERMVPGAIIVAGDAEEPFLARVVDIVERAQHKVVHLDVIGVARPGDRRAPPRQPALRLIIGQHERNHKRGEAVAPLARPRDPVRR